MKKIIALLLIAALTLSLASCGATTAKDNEKLKIISTTFPGYDFAKHVCGDLADVSILVPPGSESHSYEPTPKDIVNIENCDLFIYGGGLSDAWVDGILSSMDKDIKTIKLMSLVNVYAEETVAGMTPEDGQSKESGTDTEVEYDEHVWTSPANAVRLTIGIYNKIVRMIPEHSEKLKENYKAYVAQIKALDSEFYEFFSSVNNKLLIFGDRFPLRYFVEEFDLEYYAAFPGCSNETEPSAATMAFLINKIKEEKVSTIFYIEFSNHKVADSLAEATGTKTALFHTCHNVSAKEIEDGASYVSLMTQNLATLKEAMK